jgi:uroporphyrinogen-III synthase
MGAPAILLTRPAAQAQPLAQALRAEGWAPIIWPLLRIEAVAQADPAGAQAVVLTSANAAAQTRAAAIPALCVGPATARAARAAGFADVRSADGDAAALAALAAATLRPQDGPLAFPRGAEVAGDLAGALRAAGFAVVETVVYRAVPADAAPAEVDAALRGGRVAAAGFWSPRSAAAFAALAQPWRDGLHEATAAAISDAAAAPLAGIGFGRLLIAPSPDGDGMRAAIAAARPGNHPAGRDMTSLGGGGRSD